jgi:PIN domain nuclease of toxin-antitoxin system
VNILLDTCAFLWIDQHKDVFGPRAKELLRNTPDGTRLYLSWASVWEMAIKRALGKIPSSTPLLSSIGRYEDGGLFVTLPITLEHLGRVEFLPHHHRDPFDRLIAAQALHEGMAVLSSDSIFDKYGVQRIW